VDRETLCLTLQAERERSVAAEACCSGQNIATNNNDINTESEQHVRWADTQTSSDHCCYWQQEERACRLH